MRHRISKKHEMQKIEVEFINQSMDRLNLPANTDELARQTLVRIFRELKLSPSSDTEEKQVWMVDQESMSVQMPEHFEQLMTDIALVYSTEDSKSSSIRPKADGVLLHLSAIVRRKKDQLYADSSLPSHHIHAAPYWHFQTTTTGSDDLAFKASVDYVLWYGACGDWDTNLAVVRSSGLLDDECWAALPSMSVVYAARKARKYKGGIYGVCTDSHTWTFLHLSDRGRSARAGPESSGANKR
ncbi:unnamed protein product [Aspergillus oryzae RIB40]|uniref:DNA, SC005 n=2 Tax=Aspergillus oryzae TaxID=5062 RepID=Q2US36_ASPOR|nr:unnamed protein product [Aspergillus oryzae RIB40]EIT73992.1 hypothetical protein Ao3042_10044 [Aspergillus oryzae 3.042]KDE76974.1 hypothetical protein AO1008_02605 [Aspergillus oryzae 100-8]BAE55629.1 unnamed protein product [Aspergillus oryzae RIB40]|eukprot:EIT73992.1 hypothetical protein Ao3042_10044 [Aspergillus oryzae 3.042]